VAAASTTLKGASLSSCKTLAVRLIVTVSLATARGFGGAGGGRGGTTWSGSARILELSSVMAISKNLLIFAIDCLGLRL
jgi:hypothetical protein